MLEEDSSALTEYIPRYCAFIDILGFSERIRHLQVDPAGVDEVRYLLRSVHAAPNHGSKLTSHKDSDLKAQSISDALCLSAKCSAAGLLHLFYSIEQLAMRLLSAGYFVRGAIVKGQLYHDNSMAFGEALLRAYHLEQEVARFPRIMVTRDIAAKVKDDYIERLDIADFVDCLIQAEDGPYFLNILAGAEARAGLQLPKKPSALQIAEKNNWLWELNNIAQQIQSRFDDAVDNPKHFEKVQWFASYWNTRMGMYSPDVGAVHGPGVVPAQDW